MNILTNDSNKYPQHTCTCLGILNKVYLNISNNLSHPVLRICSIQTINITSFVIVLDVGIKRAVCTRIVNPLNTNIRYNDKIRYHNLSGTLP